MKVLAFKDLRARGIPFCRQYIHKLIKQGEFPPPIKLGAKTNGWVETEINQYLEDCLARRAGGQMKTAPPG